MKSKNIIFGYPAGLMAMVGALTFFSCDQEHVKDYYVENNCDSDILVEFHVGPEKRSLSIEPATMMLIYSHKYVFGTVGVNDDRYRDNISDLSARKDTITKPLNESLWKYEKLEKYHARYTWSIDNTLFKP